MFAYRSFALLALLLSAGSAYAQGTITSGGANYVLTASHFDTSPETNFTGVGTGDQLFESGWWFRIQGDTAETVFTAPTTQNYTLDLATINWTDLGGRSLAVTKTHTISSPGAGIGQVATVVTVTNNAATAITLHLFNMIDLDVNGSAATDNATLVQPNNYIRVADASAGTCEYRAPEAVAYLVLPFAAATDVAAQLSNATVTDFANTGLPFGPGDFTGGFQYTLQLAAGATGSVRLFVACNQTATPVSLQQFQVD
ncbi:hypothetical protein DFR29_11040 [Tahibacter aquaticus]|uniref:Uncharacterized protein n=1 Tax=Tahibacter aquaticus TaxID=520092 RepID=A0A4R6YTA4_9GAMM|nr:hypothetical protein [Tahibacter aquaticus]TDR41558.1 hypothetical protein DFR29_11040 [Tahibacter aquaticus]